MKRKKNAFDIDKGVKHRQTHAWLARPAENVDNADLTQSLGEPLALTKMRDLNSNEDFRLADLLMGKGAQTAPESTPGEAAILAGQEAAAQGHGFKMSPATFFGGFDDWMCSRSPAFLHASAGPTVLAWSTAWWMGRRAQGEPWGQLWAEAFVAESLGSPNAGFSAAREAARRMGEEHLLAREAGEDPLFSSRFSKIRQIAEAAASEWTLRREADGSTRRSMTMPKGGFNAAQSIESKNHARFGRVARLCLWAERHGGWLAAAFSGPLSGSASRWAEQDTALRPMGIPAAQWALKALIATGWRLPQDAPLAAIASRCLQEPQSVSGIEKMWAAAAPDEKKWRQCVAREAAFWLLDEGRTSAIHPEGIASWAKASGLAIRQEPASFVEGLREARAQGRGEVWAGAQALMKKDLGTTAGNSLWPVLVFSLAQWEIAGGRAADAFDAEGWGRAWRMHATKSKTPSLSTHACMEAWALRHAGEWRQRAIERIGAKRWAEHEEESIARELSLAQAARAILASVSSQLGEGDDENGEAMAAQNIASEPPAPRRMRL
jgi:hypothetical protein